MFKAFTGAPTPLAHSDPPADRLRERQRQALHLLERGDPRRSIALYTLLATDGHRLQAWDLEAESLVYRGVALHRTGQATEAVRSFTRGLIVAEAHGAGADVQHLVNLHLGQIAHEHDAHRVALFFLKRAWKLRPGAAGGLMLARALCDADRHAEAGGYLNEALQASVDAPADEAISIGLGIEHAWVSKRSCPTAHDVSLMGYLIDRATERSAPVLAARACAHLAEFHLRRDAVEDAAAATARGLSMLRPSIRSVPEHRRLLMLDARIHTHAGRWEHASAAYRRLLRVLTSTGDRDAVAHGLWRALAIAVKPRDLPARLDAPDGGVADRLTTCDLGLLSLLADGMSTRAMAARLGTSPIAVVAQVCQLMAKLNVYSRAAAVDRARQVGLVAGRSARGCRDTPRPTLLN